MATLRQLIWLKKKKKIPFTFSKSLNGNPFVRGRFLKRVIITPRKPNSALRKCGRVRLVNNKLVFTKIAGSGLIPLKYATVLVRGKGHKDTPSVKYSIVRGAYDCLTFLEKIKKRSKYQVKHPLLLRDRKSVKFK